MMLYQAEFVDKDVYNESELDIIESGKSIGKAVWRSVEEIKQEGAKLYPVGIENLILKNKL